MSIEKSLENNHFKLELVTTGVYACIHKPGGGAYSNAGIIDLGGKTLVVDALHTQAAARVLRQTVQNLTAQEVDTVVLTHAHPDHWIGAQVFDPATAFLTGKETQKACLELGPQILADFQDPEIWEEWFRETESQLQTESDGPSRSSLERNLSFIRIIIAERTTYQPRYPDRTFEGKVMMEGDYRKAEIRSMGRGHSEEDVVVLLPQDQVAFIGDIGFFDSQPFLGYSEIDLYRDQVLYFQQSGYRIFVPGHGPVGGQDDLAKQLYYFDVLEELVSSAVERGDPLEEVLQLRLPEPFEMWQQDGMERFQANVHYLYKHFGGEVPPEE